MTNKVLIIVAHSDDEALGCGGTIAKHTSQNDEVYAVFLADGVSSRPKSQIAEIEQRAKAAEKAAQLLGIKQSFTLGFPDNRMDSVPLLDIVQKIEAIIEHLQPNIIYTHHHGDLNIDHRVTHQAVLTACRPQPGFCVQKIYSFEVLSSTEWQDPQFAPFTPNVFVDISQQIQAKQQALEAYQIEMRPAPHSRSIENSLRQAALRGASIGVEYAEAFMLIREIQA